MRLVRCQPALLLALAAAVTSCREAQPRVYVVDDAVKIGSDGRILSLVPLANYVDRNPAWDGRLVTLRGARGETTAFQVMVQAGARPLEGVRVTFSDLTSDGGVSAGTGWFSAFREWYVKVTVPSESPAGSAGVGDYPDALIPADTPGWGLPVDVERGRTQGVWIDVAIPRTASPGRYRGALTVATADRVLARHEIVLTVEPFTIPIDRHLRWRTGYSGWEAVPKGLGIAEGSPEWLRLEEDLYRLLWEQHRIAPTTHYSDIRLSTRGEGRDVTIAWSSFDRRFGRYLDGSAFEDRRPLNVFSLPLNLNGGWPGRRALLDAAALRRLASEVARHWDEKGWRLEDAFVYVADEPDPARYPAIKAACEALREGNPRIRRSVAFYKEFGRHARELVEEFGGLVTMWEIAGDHADLPALRGRQLAGDSVGIYQGGEPFQGGEALDNDGLALTTWPWIAWRYRLDTLFLYNMTEWDYFRLDRAKVAWSGGKRQIWENPLNQSWPTNSQGVLVYPGAYVGIRGVVGSIRLKQVRRGMLDYEYLWLAAARGQKARAEEVARRLIPRALHEAGQLGKPGSRGAWERDPRSWAAAREELATLIGGR